jgi:hypothetical protein
MENIKKKKTDYESTKIYTKKYNQSNINVQMDRELVSQLREKIGDTTLKNFFEEYIREYLKD